LPESYAGRKHAITSGTPLLAFVTFVIFIDALGYGVVVPVLPLYAKTLGVSDFKLGMLFAAYAIALLLGAIPFGMLTDRYGRRPFILFGMFAMAGSFVFYALSSTYWMLLLGRVLNGFAGAATWSAALALVGDRFDESEMGSKMGFLISGMAVGGIAGPLFGGFLADAFGYHAPFYAIAGACFIGGILTLFLQEDRCLVRQETSMLRQLIPLLRKRTVALACVITLVTTIGFGLLEPIFPLYLKKNFKMGPSGIGVVFGVTMLAYAVTSPLVGRLSDRVGRKPPILAGLALTAVLMPLLAAFKSVAAIFVLMGLLGATLVMFETPTLPLITDTLEGEAGYGTAFGMLNFFWSLGYAIGPLLGGAIYGWKGLFAALLVYSIMLVPLIVLVSIALPGGKARPAGPVDA
jgi:multidrug resistance protein